METIAIDSPEIQKTREHIAYIGRMMFDRHLTDAAGGNISARVGDKVCLSSSLSGQKRQWQINAEDVLVVDFDAHILTGNGTLSRESQVHLSLHRHYGEYGTAVIHAHPRNLMVFASVAQPMPPVMEAMLKFGITPVVDYAPAHSKKLAENIVNSMEGRETRISKHAAGTIAPWHGLFLMGKDLDAAFDAVERFDTNAYAIIMGRMMGYSGMLDEPRTRMETIIPNYKED